MKTSVLLAVSGVALALASPLELAKRKMETEIVVEWTTVFVTDGAVPTLGFAKAHHHKSHLTTSSTSTPTPTPTPTPEPETKAPEPSVAPPPPVVETQAPPAAQDPPPTPDPAPAVTQQVQPAAPSDYSSAAVYHHNIHRINHSAPAIAWDDTYAGYAAQTAAKCVFEHDMGVGGASYGQNLAVWGSSDAHSIDEKTAVSQAATDMWYNGELPLWPAADYGKADPDTSNFMGWGHFSQLVWAGSQTLGCKTQFCQAGTIYADMDSWFTVCNYFPAGNMGGAYGDNVRRPLGGASVSA